MTAAYYELQGDKSLFSILEQGSVEQDATVAVRRVEDDIGHSILILTLTPYIHFLKQSVEATTGTPCPQLKALLIVLK